LIKFAEKVVTKLNEVVLALRCSIDKIETPNAGIFLDIMEIIIYHNAALKNIFFKT
jgi:hypothetical protein